MAVPLKLRLSIFVFAAFMCAAVSAQSNRAFLGDSTRLSTGRLPDSVVTQASVAKGKKPGFKPRLASPGASGLNFDAAVSYPSGGNGANSIAVAADLNGDGNPDLVVSSWCATGSGCANGSVAVLLGNGDGTFQTPVPYSSGGQFADSVAVADLGNGHLDLIVGNCSSVANNICSGTTGGVSVLLGDGSGVFAAAVPYATTFGVAAVAVADVNGDGNKDVVIATNCGSGPYSGCVGVLLGDGTGSLGAAVTYDSGGYSPTAIAIGDLNGDGKADVVVSHCGALTDAQCGTGNVGVLLGNGDGTFVTGVVYDSAGVYPDGVAIADVNGDGKADVVVVNSSVDPPTDLSGNLGVLLGNGDGTLQTAVAYGSGGFGGASVAVLDVNGDGKLDLIVANCSESQGDCSDNTSGTVGVGVLLGNGDGTFQTAATYAAGGNTPFGIAVADLNGDSKPDIVTANCGGAVCGASLGSVGVLLNTSLGGTTTKLTSSLNPAQSGQAVTFTATVTSGFPGTPTGTVNFFNGTTNIGSMSLNGSAVATVTTSTLAAGSDSITATYGGDTNFVTSTSSVLTQQVGGVSTTTLTLSSGTAAFGASVTLTAKVTSTAGTPADGETVTFEDSTTGTTLGTGTLASGTATFTSTTIKAGTYSVVASYPGDANNSASTSAAQTLNIQNFTLTAAPSTVSISAPGQPGTATITIATFGGLSASSVSGWTCSGLPALSTCEFGTLNSNQVPVTITTTASSDLRWPALGHPQRLFYAIWLPGFLGMVTIAGHRRKSRALQMLALIAVLSLTTVWVACGGSSSNPPPKQGTPPGTSTVTVNATSGTLQASTTLKLTVQ